MGISFVRGQGSRPHFAPHSLALAAWPARGHAYLREMGMPDTLFQAMKGTPSDRPIEETP